MAEIEIVATASATTEDGQPISIGIGLDEHNRIALVFPPGISRVVVTIDQLTYLARLGRRVDTEATIASMTRRN